MPLKWGCRGVLSIWAVWGMWVALWVNRWWYEEKEGTITWDYTYHLKLCMPPYCIVLWLYCVVYIAGGPCWRGWVVKVCYLSSSDGVSCKSPSHMCGSWYLPKILFSDWSLTWICMASFMFLVTPCGSLSTIVKHSGITWSPVEWL